MFLNAPTWKFYIFDMYYTAVDILYIRYIALDIFHIHYIAVNIFDIFSLAARNPHFLPALSFPYTRIRTQKNPQSSRYTRIPTIFIHAVYARRSR